MELFMYSSIISAIIILIVGLIKLPFKKFKGKLSYKSGLTILTILLVLVFCMLCEKYIINEAIISLSMLYLTLMTFGETMLSYNGIYEGLGLKQACKNLIIKLSMAFKKSPEAKITKIAEKYGLVVAINKLSDQIMENKAQQETEKEISEEILPQEETLLKTEEIEQNDNPNEIIQSQGEENVNN